MILCWRLTVLRRGQTLLVRVFYLVTRRSVITVKNACQDCRFCGYAGLNAKIKLLSSAEIL